jgi:hypothetical protein
MLYNTRGNNYLLVFPVQKCENIRAESESDSDKDAGIGRQTRRPWNVKGNDAQDFNPFFCPTHEEERWMQSQPWMQVHIERARLRKIALEAQTGEAGRPCKKPSAKRIAERASRKTSNDTRSPVVHASRSNGTCGTKQEEFHW